ncbi:hypothetical protein NQ156_01585 [Microbacterium sp. zg.Y625]|uniref:hypothetical protein n=1 Tax=Microbacterium jiangjiandongii TaxID=3049071 RepID=UPI00214B479F|nr:MULTISPECIES: hypothetical protein [unclassified Microbacterium]MCR2791752.1 hypothetical protein [Microbacterium sp. zg.Y625]WIM24569.1 hypothetical protein QNO14_10495 [Microbacterium sp. zg-Y625]
MTKKHRDRLMFVAVLVITGLGFSAGSVAATQGAGAALAVFGFGAIPPAALMGVVAYVWSSNDREDRARGIWRDDPPDE